VIPGTIAIDGPSASGKSTVGAEVARQLGYMYFDTGVMYRAVTLVALQCGAALDDGPAVSALAEQAHIDVLSPTVNDGRQNTIQVDGIDVTLGLRDQAIDANVSIVSAYPRVRAAMVRQQRAIGVRGGVVMIGRDIGTVVLPDADLKIFLTASVEVRARRRYEENARRGDATPYAVVLANLRRRDEIDSTRADSPLRPAPDAHIINTDQMDAAAAVRAICALWA